MDWVRPIFELHWIGSIFRFLHPNFIRVWLITFIYDPCKLHVSIDCYIIRRILVKPTTPSKVSENYIIYKKKKMRIQDNAYLKTTRINMLYPYLSYIILGTMYSLHD